MLCMRRYIHIFVYVFESKHNLRWNRLSFIDLTAALIAVVYQSDILSTHGGSVATLSIEITVFGLVLAMVALLEHWNIS